MNSRITPRVVAGPVIFPFRWDVTRPEQLGKLAEGPPAPSCPQFLDDLRCCAARVVEAAAHLAAGAGTPDLLFVGRSPESLLDYLRGICWGTTWFDRLRPLHLSLSEHGPAALRRDFPAGLASFRHYLGSLRLDPASLLTRGGPAVLVDLVWAGRTFANLIALLRDECRRRGMPWHAARRKLRLVGIEPRETKSPHGHRWHRHGPGVSRLGRSAVRSIPVPPRFWHYLGDEQPKVAESYPPAQWGHDHLARPYRSADHAPALRLAVWLFETGKTRDERARFVAELARSRGLRLATLRSLASELRRP